VADGSQPALKSVIYSGLFAWWTPPKVASLAFAIAFILLWLGLTWILYRRKIFINL
jgi:predicted acyltransferase